MTQGLSKGSTGNSMTGVPKSLEPQWNAGPQGTRMYEIADLGRIRSRSVKPRPAEKPQSSLLGVSLPFTGRRFPLKPVVSTIGRAAENDVVLNDAGISFMHAKIINENGNWRVLNLLSTNGTFVNGVKITLSPLKPGDRVRFGRAEFLFDCGEKGLPSGAGKQLPSNEVSTAVHSTSSLNLVKWLAAGASLLAIFTALLVLT